jgi:PAS domain S-box-containing protein
MNTKTANSIHMSSLVSTLLSLTDEAVVILDLAGSITGWSQGAERLLGYRSREAAGLHCADICISTDRGTYAAHLRDLDPEGNPTTFETTLKRADGQLRLAHVQMMLVQGDSGAPGCILCKLVARHEPGSSREVSTSHLRELWSLLDSVPVAFAHLDGDCRFLYANQAALRNTPAGTSVVFGRHIRDVFGDEIYAVLKPQIDTVLSGQECMREISFPLGDGVTHHFVRHLYPQRSEDGTVRGYFSAIVDITDAKATQQSELRREHLLRSTLVREINHRVKNSLQGLIGLLRLYDAQQTSPAAALDHCVSQLMAVAVSFGLASKHGEARILLCDMVQDIARSVGQLAGRQISVELLPLASGQPVALSKQHSVNISLVINELIFNAIKHSADAASGPAVHIVVDRSNDSAVLRVVNSSGSLPEGFSFPNGKGLGTGLNLVKVLVPPGHCDLSITQEPEGIVAILRLHSPILSPG